MDVLTSCRGPDFYHSCYVLLGLSSIQHYFYYVETAVHPPAPSSISSSDSFNTAPSEAAPADEVDLPLTAAFQWRYSTRIPSIVKGVFEPVVEDLPMWPDDVEDGVVGDRLEAHHPLFNVPFENVAVVEDWLRRKVGF